MANPLASEVAQRLSILRFQILQSFAIPPLEYLRPMLSQWSEKQRDRFVGACQERSEQVIYTLKESGLWEHTTPAEKEFFQAKPLSITAQQHIDASWRIESAIALMWALQIVSESPPFDTSTEVEELKKVPSGSVREILKHAELRSQDEIEHMRSLAELWHWRSRTRRLIEDGYTVDPELGVSSFDEIVRIAAKEAYRRGDMSEIIDEDFGVRGKAYRDLTDEEWSEIRSITMERHLALNWLCGYAPGNRWEDTPTGT